MAEDAAVETTSGSAPAAFSTATATDSRWSMRALRRWAGSTCGFPAVEAFTAAAESASWLLVVNLASMCLAPFLPDDGGVWATAARRPNPPPRQR